MKKEQLYDELGLDDSGVPADPAKSMSSFRIS
jgi:hypothetical protein